MSSNKSFIIDTLDDIAVQAAISLKANVIVCNEKSSSIAIPENISMINAEIYRIEGTWKAYEYNRNIVNTLLKKKSNYFKIDSISIEACLCKLLYWTNYKTGALRYVADQLGSDNILLNPIPFFPGSKWKGILKFAKWSFKNRLTIFKRSTTIPNIESNAKIGILVNDEFELKLYKKVIKKLEPSSFILFHYGNINFQKIDFLSEKTAKVNLEKIVRYEIQPFIYTLSLSAEELSALNSINTNRHQIASELMRYKYIMSTGIKKLLVNVAENLPYRNLMPEVFGKDIQVYNTMNGIKSGEAHDADVHFDYWFIWDELMKDLMVEACGLPESKLIISGHLSQDFISEFTFRNSIGVDTELLKHSKVISLYSVRGKRKEKLDAFEILYSFMANNPDCLLLVKPHPLEKPSDYIMPPKDCKNIIYIAENLKNSKEALYDQLMVSDLNIVFGSTVALESHWMGVPCVSFEYRKKSFIYMAGKSDIQHLRTKSDLLGIISSTQKRKEIKPASHSDVADQIVSRLCSIN